VLGTIQGVSLRSTRLTDGFTRAEPGLRVPLETRTANPQAARSKKAVYASVQALAMQIWLYLLRFM
jgi:hypothetical protein